MHVIDVARVEKLKRQEEEERRVELQLAEDVLTGGVKCSGDLSAVLDTSGSEDDRVLLPQSYFDTLMQQDAFSGGAASFRLTSGSGITTHCGVREFTAMEDTIVLPQKVFDSLFGEAGTAGTVTAKYIRLPKVTQVKLQPKQNSFYSIENVKLMLEDNLKHHSTLTVGDIVTVWYRGQRYTLTVSAMQPEPQGSLIDTDVEVDLDESVEYKQHIQKEEEVAKLAAAAAPSGHVLGSAAGPRTASAHTTVFRKLDSAGQTPHTSDPVAPVLISTPIPPEPISGFDGAINCKFRIMGGSITRRFMKSDSVAVLFAYLRSVASLDGNLHLRDMCGPCKVLQLTTRFPNRVIVETDASVGAGLTLSDADITSSIDFIVGVV